MNLTDEQNTILKLLKSTPRILVTAPPGCGKTTLIKYLLECLMDNNEIGPHNSVLLMSFSTSAAQKIKLELREKILNSPKRIQLEYFLKEKTLTTNYHGLCRGILARYGYMLVDKNTSHYKIILDVFKNIGKLPGHDEKEANNIVPQDKIVPITKKLDTVKNSIYPHKEKLSNEQIEEYCEIMLEYFLPKGKITYNGIIFLVILLFQKFPDLKQAYLYYFSHIVVDEFQDTNILAWQLLDCFLNDTPVKFYGFGDPLQKLYGFIGAVDDVFGKAKEEWSCNLQQLTINQRYKNTPALLETTEYIRSFAESSNISQNFPDHRFKMFTLNSDVIENIQLNFSKGSCAILFSDRYSGHEDITNSLKTYHIPYFLAMFPETGDYTAFHHNALELWRNCDTNNSVVQNLKLLIQNMKARIDEVNKETYIALVKLLELAMEQFKKSGIYWFLNSYEQFQIIEDTLSNDGLKQFIDKVTDCVILSTIHAAKGQQWDFTIVKFSRKNILTNWQEAGKLSVIYVAISRASKECSILELNPCTYELLDAITV